MKKRIGSLLLLLPLLLTCCAAPSTLPSTTTEGGGSDAPSETIPPVTDPPVTYESVTLTDFSALPTIGRVLPPQEGRLGLEWTGSGFVLRGWFDGPITALLYSEGGLGVMVNVEVDGVTVPSKRLELGIKRLTLCNVEKGYHTIVFRKTSEGSTSRLQLRSLSFTGMLDTSPAEAKPLIEFIGDSITCGVGSYPEAVGAQDWDYLTHCDFMHSYAAMTARALGADATLAAVSGWGVVCGATSPSHRIPDIYELTSYVVDPDTKWDFTARPADVVVIALGTNDGAATAAQKAEYKASALAFLQKVREKNPDAFIVWQYGMMGREFESAIREAVAEMKDERVVYLSQKTNGAGGWGHPSYEAQKGYAEALSELLRPELAGE